MKRLTSYVRSLVEACSKLIRIGYKYLLGKNVALRDDLEPINDTESRMESGDIPARWGTGFEREILRSRRGQRHNDQ